MIVIALEAVELLKELVQKGIRLSVNSHTLRAEGNLTDDLKNRMKAHRFDLFQLVEMGEHRWGPGEGWESGEDGDWPEGSRLDESEYIRWGL